jgi:hypothetical protein
MNSVDQLIFIMLTRYFLCDKNLIFICYFDSLQLRRVNSSSTPHLVPHTQLRNFCCAPNQVTDPHTHFKNTVRSSSGIILTRLRFKRSEFDAPADIFLPPLRDLFRFLPGRKSKAVPLHAMETFGGERRYSSYSFLLILDLGTRWGWVVSVTPRPRFTPGERTPVPIVQEVGWALEPVWTQRLQEKSFAPAEDRTSIARSSSP